MTNGSYSKFPTVGNAANALPVNEWVHIAVTYDAGKLCIYVNGKLQSSGTCGYGAINWGTYAPIDQEQSTRGFHIGYSMRRKRELAGEIAEVRIWDRVLTAEEIAAPDHFYTVDPPRRIWSPTGNSMTGPAMSSATGRPTATTPRLPRDEVDAGRTARKIVCRKLRKTEQHDLQKQIRIRSSRPWRDSYRCWPWRWLPARKRFRFREATPRAGTKRIAVSGYLRRAGVSQSVSSLDIYDGPGRRGVSVRALRQSLQGRGCLTGDRPDLPRQLQRSAGVPIMNSSPRSCSPSRTKGCWSSRPEAALIRWR